MNRVLRALWLIISTSVRVDPLRSLLCLAESVGVLMSVLQPLFLAWIINGAIHRDPREVLGGAAALLASVAADKALCMIGVNARIRQLELVSHVFQAQVAEVTARIPTLDHLESPQYLDQSQLLRERSGTLGVALNTLLNALNDVIRVAGTLLLAASADRRALLVAAAGLPLLLATRWFVVWQARAEAESAQPARLTNHLLRLGISDSAGAEIRVFGSAELLRRRLHQASTAWRRPFTVLARRTAVIESVCNAIYFAVAGIVLLWLVSDVVAGRIPVESFTLALLLVNRIQAGNQDLLDAARKVVDMTRTTMRLLWLRDYEQQAAAIDTAAVPSPNRLTEGIDLDGLGFQYATGSSWALKDVSLHLSPGAVVAIVGENGAGKTTLVKLLTGMYRPSAGRILVDGIDLAEVDTIDWRNHTTAALQDYLRPEFTADEAIGFGDLLGDQDQQQIVGAARRGSADTIIDRLPHRYRTQLGSDWPEGVDLSGGQWQRFALARGMMREHPLLLVLDEPTAALDAAAEHELFERYAAAATNSGAAGTITLLITHRFSTVAAADLIMVLDHGSLREVGSHSELIGQNGHYAELYRLQSRGYKS
ncbi:MAG TPA: ABC transporter ATP-binding protein [Microlunatus sp.]